MMIILHVWTFLLLCYRPVDSVVECTSCAGALSLSECNNKTINCAHDEECYLEMYTNNHLQTVYNAGCRNKTTCMIIQVISSFGKRTVDFNDERKRSDLMICSECCNTTTNKLGPCNMQLCNQSIHTTHSNFQCLNCDLVARKTDCQRKLCSPSQICAADMYIRNGAVRYSLYCEEENICQAHAEAYKQMHRPITDRRSDDDNRGVKFCSACCRGHECNKEECYVIRERMLNTTFTQSPSVAFG